MMEYDQTPEAKKKLQIMKNRTKKVSSYEFLMEKIWEKHDNLHTAFKQMDKDGSGSLSASELRGLLESYAWKVPDAVFADLLGMFDADSSGEISFAEFSHTVKRLMEPSGYTHENGYGDERRGSNIGGGGYRSTNTDDLEDPDGQIRLAAAKKAAVLREKVARSSKAFKNICAKIYSSHGSIREAFTSIDKDKSGFLDPDELKQLFEKSGTFVSDAIFAEILETFDEDNDGCVNFHEFVAKLKDIMEPSETGGVGAHLASKEKVKKYGRVHGGAVDKSLNVRKGHSVGAALRFVCEKIHEKWDSMRTSFRMLDRDGSGTISPEEFKACLDNALNYEVSPEVFDQLVDIFDTDGDNEISYDELLSQMQKVLAGDMSDLDRAEKVRVSLEKVVCHVVT